jgi:tetratricopeptide (TPR) repeat protein
VQKFSQWKGGVAALAVLTMAATTCWAQGAAAPQKAVKDQAEFDLFDAVKKDLLQGNGAKAVTDLDAWKQHNPDSAFKDDREVMYLKAYELSKDYDKELTKAKELMGHDLDAMFSDPAQGPGQVVSVYFAAVTAASALPNPTPEQLAIGAEAAHKILDYKRDPKGIDPAAWATAKKQLAAAADALLYKAAFLPPYQAEQKKDYDTAVGGYQKAIADYPSKTALTYRLGITLRAQHKDDLAIWQFARVVGVDPTLDGTAKAADITKFLNVYYHNLHGSDEGLDQVIQQAKASATPPADFHVKTAQEIATENEAKFEKDHPDIALWMKLKATLTSDQGQQYFDSGMKGAQVPELTGTVLESACRAKELKVAVPLPDATGPPTAEITLKLVNDAGAPSALPGKAESGRVTFVGVAEAFAKDPFNLTMTIDKKDIKDLKVTPCAAPAARKGVTKKK